MITLYNEDCLPAMKKMQDNQFDLAIVDPPYGIGMGGGNGVIVKKTLKTLQEMITAYQHLSTLNN